MKKLNVASHCSPDFISAPGRHELNPFTKAHIDVKLTKPNADTQLLIFKPIDNPSLWSKYLEGLWHEYSRMGVQETLSMDKLSNPASTSLAIVAMIDGEVMAGLRFHGPLKQAGAATVLKEMALGDPDLLREYIEKWLPEGVVEPKGLWVNTKSTASTTKRCLLLLRLMARSVIYGTLMLDSRFAICASPKTITRIHKSIGIEVIPEIGCVPYPNQDHKTSFGFFDINHVMEKASAQNKILLKDEWQQIQHARINNTANKPGDHWRATILDEGNPFHRQAIESLTVDTRYTRHTEMAVMKKELDEILPPVNDELKQEHKRWVVYPWRKVAIELLGPVSFRKLRYDRNRNKITDSEQRLLSSLKIGIIGLSTGHAIAHNLAMEGVGGLLKLADFDSLEISNLNRIPATLLDINVNKAVLTARRIAELDPYLEIDVFEEGITTANINNFMYGLDIIIEECDSLDIKMIVREAAKAFGIPVLMATSDSGMMDVERFDIEKDLKPFHGLIETDSNELKDLSRRDKAGYALAILEGHEISKRLAASMTEIDHSIRTWPQLASDVNQGAAMMTTAVRHIGLKKPLPSGRIRMDMAQSLSTIKPPTRAFSIDTTAPDTPEFSSELKPDMLLAARYAPSPGNIQPWKMTWRENEFNIELRRDLTTRMDVKWRGALVSIGAACLNAEILAAHHGMLQATSYFPEAADNNPAVKITLNQEPQQAESSIPANLLPYVLTRSTNRNLGERREIPNEVMGRLAQVTELYPIKLHTLTSPEKMAHYQKISQESDRLRHLSRHLHREMMQELVWPEKIPVEQGIDVRTLGLPEKDLNVLPVIQRTDVMEKLAEWNAGKALGDYNRDRIACASAMVVLSVQGQSEQDYLMGGKALQHFWLLAEQNGLAIHPVSPIFLYANQPEEIETLMKGQYLKEVAELKSEFNSLLSIRQNEFPVLVLRLSYAENPVYRSSRRHVTS